MFARHIIDSLEFARNGKELRGEIAVAGMPRLQDMLASPEGKISYLVRGHQDKSGKPMLELAMDGSCQLICQRCLSGFDYPVHLASHLLLEQEGETSELSHDDEGPDSILADKHLDVEALLEEELLLSLPFAPKHPPGVCEAVVKGAEQPGNAAFAALAKLKGK